MNRIYIPNMGPNLSTIPVALTIGIRECKLCGSDQLTLITSLKNNLDSIVVGEFLGEDVCKKLMQGERISIGDHGIALSHESVSTLQKHKTPKVGLAFYISKKDLKKLDELLFEHLIFVPWLDDEGIDWAKKWDAETHKGTTLDSKISLPPKVEESMKNLTKCVNLSTGLSHPSDKEHAKRKFSELKSLGFTWNPSEIEKWAVRNGWKASYAEELSKLS